MSPTEVYNARLILKAAGIAVGLIENVGEGLAILRACKLVAEGESYDAQEWIDSTWFHSAVRKTLAEVVAGAKS